MDANSSSDWSAAISSDMTAAALPADFADLAQFSDWILETWRERYDKRLASTMDEMQALYDSITPRIGEILSFCNRHDLADLPSEVRNLMLLLFSLCEASLPVEAWRQPRVPDSGAADFTMVAEPRL